MKPYRNVYGTECPACITANALGDMGNQREKAHLAYFAADFQTEVLCSAYCNDTEFDQTRSPDRGIMFGMLQ